MVATMNQAKVRVVDSKIPQGYMYVWWETVQDIGYIIIEQVRLLGNWSANVEIENNLYTKVKVFLYHPVHPSKIKLK